MDSRVLRREKVSNFLNKIDKEDVFRWCEPDGYDGCGCMGCVQSNMSYYKFKITKDEWIDWKEQLKDG